MVAFRDNSFLDNENCEILFIFYKYILSTKWILKDVIFCHFFFNSQLVFGNFCTTCMCIRHASNEQCSKFAKFRHPVALEQITIFTAAAKDVLRFWDHTLRKTSSVVVTIASNDHPFRLSNHLHRHYSKCYFVHRHLNNASYNKADSQIKKPYLVIIASNGNRLCFMAMRIFSNIGDFHVY